MLKESINNGNERVCKMKSDIVIRNEIIEYTQAIKNHKALVAILKFIKLMYKNTAHKM